MKTRYRVQFRAKNETTWHPLRSPHGLRETRAEAEKLLRQIETVMVCDLRIVDEIKTK